MIPVKENSSPRWKGFTFAISCSKYLSLHFAFKCLLLSAAKGLDQGKVFRGSVRFSEKVKYFFSQSTPWEAQSVLPDMARELGSLCVTLDKSLYRALISPQSDLSSATWKDWFILGGRYSSLCSWQMISCLDMKSHVVNYKRFLLLGPEYLTTCLWSALGKCQHKHWWALTSRRPEKGRETRALVRMEGVSLSPKQQQKLKNPSVLFIKCMDISFALLTLQSQLKRWIFWLRV